MSGLTPCAGWREVISAYQDNQLEGRDRASVERHLAVCEPCRQLLAQLEADRSRFLVAYEASTGGAELRTAVMEELRIMNTTQPQTHPSFPMFTRILSIAGMAAAACLALALTALLVRGISGVLTSPNAGMAKVPTQVGAPAPTMPRPSTTASTVAEPGVAVGPMANPPELSRRVTAEAGKKTPAPAEIMLLSEAPNTATYTYNIESSAADRIAQAKPAWEPPAMNNLNAVVQPHAGPAAGSTPGNLHIAYDVDYRLKVKNALAGAREAKALIQQHGGFVIDFSSGTNDEGVTFSVMSGKIPTAQADKVLAEIEKLGQVKSLNMNGNDLTQQYLQQQDELERQQKRLEEIRALAAKSRNGDAIWGGQINQLEGQVKEAERGLQALKGQTELMNFYGEFEGPKAPEPMTFERVMGGTWTGLKYALLLLITLAAYALIFALLISPFILWRRARRRQAMPVIPQTVEETEQAAV